MTATQEPVNLPEPFGMKGKRVLITGAAGGIGSAAVRICTQMGAEVIRLDILDAGEMSRRDGSAAAAPAYHQCDTTDRRQVEALMARIGPVDSLIEAAGICPFEDWTNDDWDTSFDKVIDVNLRGPINLARAVVPGMRLRGGGQIAFCGSVAGFTGGVRGGPHYAAAKGGVHAFLRWLAQHVARDLINVNAVAPGTTDTPMTRGQGYDPSYYPQKRFAYADEIAATLAFLCSPAAGFISGAIIDINGGTYFH